MEGDVMSEWREVWRDTDRIIEQRVVGEGDGANVEQRSVWTNPAIPAAVEHARSLGFTDDMIRAMYPAISDAL
jgi:DNA polymerase III epsilon subunit-like protein